MEENTPQEKQEEYKYAFNLSYFKIDNGGLKKELNLRQGEFNISICRDFVVLSDENDFGSVNLFFKYIEHAEKVMHSNKIIIDKYNIRTSNIVHSIILKIKEYKACPIPVESKVGYRLELIVSDIKSYKEYK